MYKVYGQHDEATLRQMERCMAHDDAIAGVLCADGHLGYNHPIGGVVGYANHISLSGVGFDIGCGNLAVQTDAPWAELAPYREKIIRDIQANLSFGVGRVNGERVDHALFESELWDEADVRHLKPMAQQQLGTIGSGNHYVDLMSDQNGMTWIGLHFGSRGLGHKTTTKYMKIVGAKDEMEGEPVLLPADSDLGRAYYAGVKLGGLYAYAGRNWVAHKVAQLLDVHMGLSIHNHHNYCWEEEHGGQKLYVVRKGATPANPDQQGFVGGSMGDMAVVLRGVDSDLSRESLYSTVHGAGRVMSRMAARGKVDRRTGEVKREGLVSREAMTNWLTEFQVEVIGGDVDESPQVYRRLPEVLAYHKGTVAIDYMLRPRMVFMAGANEFDPFKD